MANFGHGRLIIATTMALLAVAPPCHAEVNEVLYRMYGITVPFGPSGGEIVTLKRYLYSPFLGVYTIGPDENFKGMTPIEAEQHRAFLPKADRVLLGNPISDVSGSVQPIDQNRIQIDEGMNEAVPQGFRQLRKLDPWYSVPDSEVCAAVFRDAWTFSANVTAPEVEVYSVRLPNQKLATEAMVIGATRKDFPIVVTSAFGQICLKGGARALVCRSLEGLRVFNLTGRMNSVMVRFPSGKVLAIGPGSELVAARSRERLNQATSDGIARRGASPVFSADDIFATVNEFSAASVLRATGLSKALATTDDTGTKHLCHSVIKTAAALAIMRGTSGFTGESNGHELVVHKAEAAKDAKNSVKPPSPPDHQRSPDVLPAAHTDPAADEKLPPPPKSTAIKRYIGALRAPLRTIHLGSTK